MFRVVDSPDTLKKMIYTDQVLKHSKETIRMMDTRKIEKQEIKKFMSESKKKIQSSTDFESKLILDRICQMKLRFSEGGLFRRLKDQENKEFADKISKKLKKIQKQVQQSNEKFASGLSGIDEDILDGVSQSKSEDKNDDDDGIDNVHLNKLIYFLGSAGQRGDAEAGGGDESDSIDKQNGRKISPKTSKIGQDFDQSQGENYADRPLLLGDMRLQLQNKEGDAIVRQGMREEISSSEFDDDEEIDQVLDTISKFDEDKRIGSFNSLNIYPSRTAHQIKSIHTQNLEATDEIQQWEFYLSSQRKWVLSDQEGLNTSHHHYQKNPLNQFLKNIDSNSKNKTSDKKDNFMENKSSSKPNLDEIRVPSNNQSQSFQKSQNFEKKHKMSKYYDSNISNKNKNKSIFHTTHYTTQNGNINIFGNQISQQNNFPKGNFNRI